MEPITKDKLRNYIFLKMEIENQLERLARMKNDELIPAQTERDGSKHSVGASDRMANAVIRRLSFQDAIHDEMEKKLQEMECIQDAISALEDPQEREVLRLRYIYGEGCRYMPWREISMKLYGDADDRSLHSTFRVHGRALQDIYDMTSR